ncbi:MAG: hypothetical protein PUC50_04300 [Bacteroidales bacterium]|nr:hypothetical protein [Bacteroidales bacterium]
MTDTAYLSNEGRYTIFEFNGTRLKIIAPEPLVKYLKITDFDPKIGYIAVLTDYSCFKQPEEEYIDLKPTLNNLLMDADDFLKPIKKLEIRYDTKS